MGKFGHNKVRWWQKSDRLVEDRVIASQLEALLTPAITAQENYYQQQAANRTIVAIARGQKRCLLVMATGAGKTYTVFNIIWRLWKTKVVKRVLFQADCNALVDQTITNDFRPFGEVMTKLDRRLVDNLTGRINTSYQIYLGLYHARSLDEGQAESSACSQRPPKQWTR